MLSAAKISLYEKNNTAKWGHPSSTQRTDADALKSTSVYFFKMGHPNNDSNTLHQAREFFFSLIHLCVVNLFINVRNNDEDSESLFGLIGM